MFTSRTPRTFLGAVLIAIIAACGARAPQREWTPDDHGQPQRDESADLANAAEAESGDGVDPTARAARALWNVSCAACHGREGRGDGASRPPGATLPDFAAGAWHDARTDEAIAGAIKSGRGMMPEFGSKLPNDAIRALVAHVRTLREAKP